MTTDEIRVAVVTGRHAYDVVAFQNLWRSLPGIDAYPQHMEAYVADSGKARAWYDVVVFYNYHQALPGEEVQGLERDMRRVLERLGESEQGIVLLHHGLVAFLDWTWWSELCGIQERAFRAHKGQTVCVEVGAGPSHHAGGGGDRHLGDGG